MTKLRYLAPIAIAATALGACQTVGEVPPAPLGRATLHFANGQPAGTAQLTAAGDGVSITVALAGLPQGTHAVHLHTAGSCEAPDFKSAGGHLNPGMKQHGMQNPMGAHLGDLPNVEIAVDGTGGFTAKLRGTKAELIEDIYDADGTAVVVHAGPDDNMSDPAGNAGNRIACGVITAH